METSAQAPASRQSRPAPPSVGRRNQGCVVLCGAYPPDKLLPRPDPLIISAAKWRFALGFLLAALALPPSSQAGRSLPLRLAARVPLSGPAVRFDYTSFDPTTNRLWIAHMDAAELLAFDVVHRRIVKTIAAPG